MEFLSGLGAVLAVIVSMVVSIIGATWYLASRFSEIDHRLDMLDLRVRHLEELLSRADNRLEAFVPRMEQSEMFVLRVLERLDLFSHRLDSLEDLFRGRR